VKAVRTMRSTRFVDWSKKLSTALRVPILPAMPLVN